jgi:flavin-dependent dehydrogenase
MKLEEPFAVYSRIAFDTFLRDRARAAGAVVIADKVSGRGFKRASAGLSPASRASENKKENLALRPSPNPLPKGEGELNAGAQWIVHTQSGTEFTCKYLVGADGANSAIAKKLAGPLPPAEMEVAFGYRAPLPGASDAATVVAFLPKWVGYAWAFPRIDHVSFGIATTQDAFDHEALDSLLWDFMVSYYDSYRAGSDGAKSSAMKLWKSAGAISDSILRELKQSAERYAARIPGLAPRTWDTRKACGDGWALLGDAAGFADPVTGEGIYYALRSAELFAKAFLKRKPESYEQLWRKDFGGELKRASQMRRRFYGNFWGAPFTDRMIEFARGHRGIRKVLGQLVAGDQGYVNLKKKLARSALKPL